MSYLSVVIIIKKNIFCFLQIIRINVSVMYIPPTGHHLNTGRFIMYSGITKNYYRKPVGHVFTKHVQTELKKCVSKQVVFSS